MASGARQSDGNNPVFMYGYGAWVWAAFPWQSHMVPWVEMGGIYAVPNIGGAAWVPNFPPPGVSWRSRLGDDAERKRVFQRWYDFVSPDFDYSLTVELG
jgi:prolyl oligopeptidase PreP (S9A serine peptidase family)